MSTSFFWNTAAAVVLAFWMFRDAKARSFNAPVWGFTAFFSTALLLPVLGGLLVTATYLALRPKGGKRRCPHCEQLYLAELVQCPHCRRQVKKDCHHCAAAVPVEADRCLECNHPL